MGEDGEPFCAPIKDIADGMPRKVYDGDKYVDSYFQQEDDAWMLFVVMEDRSEIICSHEHLWPISDDDGKITIVKTRDLVKGNQICILPGQGIKYEDKRIIYICNFYKIESFSASAVRLGLEEGVMTCGVGTQSDTGIIDWLEKNKNKIDCSENEHFGKRWKRRYASREPENYFNTLREAVLNEIRMDAENL